MRVITVTPRSGIGAARRRRPRPALVVLLLGCLLLPAGCGESGAGSGGAGSAAPTSGSPRPQTLEQEIADVRTLLEKFWTAQFQAWGRQYPPLRKFGAYQPGDNLMCGPEQVPPNNAVYCPIGDFIAYDEVWMADYYKRIGDGPVYVIIPHEWGHAIQARLGQQYRLSVQRELQADCFAGAFLKGALESGAVVEEPGDAQEIFANFVEVADPTDAWWRPDAHGTLERRTGAFRTGVSGGPDAC